MKVKEKKWIRLRIYVVAIFFLGGMAVILGRAFQFQVLERQKLATIAAAGVRGIVRLPPKRGTIYDREGHELAVSIEVASIYAHPKQVADKIHTSNELARLLDLKQGTVLNLLKSDRPFVWITRKIPSEKARLLQELKLEGVGVTTETRRYYPGKEIAAHLIGFAGEDSQGLEGVERKYDHLLRGPESTLVQMRDALKRPFYISRPVADGQQMHHLTLTIDKDIQYKAEQALKEVVDRTKAKSGHCIIVNPKTGEILAMAVAPLFNPNNFGDYPAASRKNQIVTDCFEPGSTMKVFVMAGAIDKGVVTPQTPLFCENGAYPVGSHVIHEHDSKRYGTLTVSDIITVSSNIGAIKIGQKLGYKKHHEYLRKFGFGEKTGIDLIGERDGFLRSPKDAREIEKATTAFGHGMTATPLQLVMAMSAIANQGVLMKPHVVKAVTDQRGRVVQDVRPQVVRRVMSVDAAQKATQILETVVGEKGTAKQAAIIGYKVAGKTGTAQKVDPRTKTYSRRAHLALFTGFVPAEDPRLAMLVIVDEPQGAYYGGVVAAPVFRQVGEWTLNHLRVNPQVRMAEAVPAQEKRPEKEPVVKTAYEPAEVEVGLLPDFRGQTMREVLKGGNSLGVKVVLEGTGLAVGQTPEPGSPLDRVDLVKVNFSPPS